MLLQCAQQFLVNLLASRYEGYYAKLHLAIRELDMDGWILDITMSLFGYLSINPNRFVQGFASMLLTFEFGIGAFYVQHSSSDFQRPMSLSNTQHVFRPILFRSTSSQALQFRITFYFCFDLSTIYFMSHISVNFLFKISMYLMHFLTIHLRQSGLF